MTEKEFEDLKIAVLADLDALDPHLTYHSKAHTKDVLKQAIRIARDEAVSDVNIMLLKVAALFHDTGFLETYANHEAVGCDIFMRKTKNLSLTAEEREIIQGVIMATRIPQQPQTLLQQILCDADLDYLGRDDFFEIGTKLKKEFLHYGIVKTNEDWEKMQLNFLKNHRYHTRSSQQLREPVKQHNFQQL